MNLTSLLKLGWFIDRFSQKAYRDFSTRILRFSGVDVQGSPLWISPKIYWDLGFQGAISLGDRCVVSHGVRLLTHDFSLDRVAEAKNGISETEYVRQARVVIGRGAFIGMGAILMPGVSIGDFAVVGAGAVVTKDVPISTVVAGNPARFISTTDDYWEKKKQEFSLQRRRP